MSIANPVIDFIDGANRRIHLRSGVSVWNPVDDIYVEVKQLRQNDESLRNFDMFCSALPLVNKGGGETTGRGLQLLLGTRIVPFDEDANHVITGELLSDEGLSGTALVDLSTLSAGTKIKISYEPPPATEVVNGGGSGLGAEDAAKIDANLRYAQDIALNMQPH